MDSIKIIANFMDLQLFKNYIFGIFSNDKILRLLAKTCYLILKGVKNFYIKITLNFLGITFAFM